MILLLFFILREAIGNARAPRVRDAICHRAPIFVRSACFAVTGNPLIVPLTGDDGVGSLDGVTQKA